MVNEYGLTDNQEAFAQAFITSKNASEAYRQAYSTKNMKPESVNRMAKKLIDNVKVLSRINKLREEHRERHNMTVDDIIRELEEARQIAKEDGKAAPMVSASMGKAKVLGLIIDKQEIKTLEPPKIVVELTSGQSE
ncbi:hypothetical protein BWD09_07070 [Neisseria dentiae]|uniref:Terminase small subunit n=1 Tax=Neisseria dentiae TaxID=194197 RepID=A0A1X3D9S8_9NEIS|nr:hypothetical protein BWD09_07070 [Neisseria dentiae]